MSFPSSMRSLILSLFVIVVFASVTILLFRSTDTRSSPASPNAAQATSYGQIEMSFEANKGQTDPSVDFLARGAGYALFLKPTEAVLSLSRSKSTDNKEVISSGERAKSNLSGEPALLRMQLAGSNEKAEAVGTHELEGKANYFIGNDESKWLKDVPTFGRVRYSNVYDGIDVEYYGNQRQLEYDFRVAVGADYRQISLNFEGSDSVRTDDASGDLLIDVSGETVRQQRPIVYQELGTERQYVDARFFIDQNRNVGFDLGSHNPDLPVIIDPVLSYSTYLGGNSEDVGRDIAVDSGGNAYIIGNTLSTDFPVTNPIKGYTGEGIDVFVTKLNPTGTARVYSTFLGGGANDFGFSVAVDASGNAYLTGYTLSLNFPLANPLQAVHGGGNFDAFVTKINSSGSAIAYSTYLGGPSQDYGRNVSVDTSQSVYVTGEAGENFPLANPIQGVFGGGELDVFVSKFGPAGNSLVYSTYLGGNNYDLGTGLTTDQFGNAYLTGGTSSPNFPTTPGSFQPTKAPSSDVFITKINPAGTAIGYSTFVGGGGGEQGLAVAVSDAGNVYVTGSTTSLNFPVVNAIQAIPGGGSNRSDAFVAKLNSSGSALQYSTYLGGSFDDYGHGISLDQAEFAYIVGSSDSANFPTVNPIQPANLGSTDAFLAKINPNGSQLVYSTYFGGAQYDIANAVASDTFGNAYLTGFTYSANLPTLFPMQELYGGIGDAFVAKIGDVAGPTPSPTPLFPGGLDPTFGVNGKATITLPSVYGARSVAVQTDGRLVIAASANGSNGNEKFSVVRLNSDASIDTTFGNSGVSTFEFGQFSRETIASVAIQADGKIIAAGAAQGDSGGYDFAVARLNANGTLDPSFNDDGKIRVPITVDDDYGRHIVLQADGKIIVSGKSRLQTNNDATLIRLTLLGELDTSFNGTGIVTVPISAGASQDEFEQAAVQPDGKIVAVGSSSGQSTGDFAVLRFNPNGTLDSTFGSGGKVLTDIGGQYDRAFAVAVEPNGRILVGGAANSGSGDFAGMVRYNSNGSLDTSFGSQGIVTISPSVATFSVFKSVLLQGDGKVIGVGSGPDQAVRGDFRIARFSELGSLDNNFGPGGLVHTRFGNLDSCAYGAALQPDHKLVVVGIVAAPNDSYATAVARYLLDPSAVTPTPTATPTPTPVGYESDVAPRPDGDGSIVAGDVVQMRRFVAGLDAVNPATNEFQRTDTAPRATLGDGMINSTDVVQARRYGSGLDPLTNAGGPAVAADRPLRAFIGGSLFGVKVAKGDVEGSLRLSSGKGGAVFVELESSREVAAVSFRVRYDATLGKPSVSLSDLPDGAVLTVNDTVDGELTILIDSAEALGDTGKMLRLVEISFADGSADGSVEFDGEASVSDTLGNDMRVSLSSRPF